MNVQYSIRRSASRRKVTITVDRERSVVVHAPQGVNDEAVQKVVESKKQWIMEKVRHQQKYQQLPHPPGKELVNGESALYLGRNYRIEIVAEGLDEVQFTQRFLVPASHLSMRKGALREWYIARAKEKILDRVAMYAKRLGVKFKRAKIVDNRYRWGSCTVKDNLNFNWRLIKAPMYVIDYVVVHELAHLIEPNHTPRFWNIVRATIPGDERARGWLREHGQVLEDDV